MSRKKSKVPVFDAAADNPGHYYARWKTQMRRYEYDHAEKVARAGIADYPQDARLYNCLGRTLRLKETQIDDNEALESFHQAHLLMPSDVGFVVDYANFCAKQGLDDLAELTLFRAYERHRHSEKLSFVLGGLGMLYASSRPGWAVCCYQKCLEIDPFNDFAKRLKSQLVQQDKIPPEKNWAILQVHMQRRLAYEGISTISPETPEKIHA